MSQLPAAEARALLDAMGISVVKLRSPDTDAPPHQPAVPLDLVATVAAPEPIPVATDPEVSEPSEVGQVDVRDTSTPEVSSQGRVEPAPETVSESDPAAREPDPVCPPFSVISARSRAVLLVAELPDWSDGLLDGRLGALLGDILQSIGCERETVDWQYFRWPLAGLVDQSLGAAQDALDAWMHRRWGELEGSDPLLLVHLMHCDAQVLAPDAIALPALDALLVTPALKRSLWDALRSYARST